MRRDLLPSSDNKMKTFSSVALRIHSNVPDVWYKWVEKEALSQTHVASINVVTAFYLSAFSPPLSPLEELLRLV